jgi:hypothetical protein
VAGTGKIIHLNFNYIATTSCHVGRVRNKFVHLAVFLNSAKKSTNNILFKMICTHTLTHTHTHIRPVGYIRHQRMEYYVLGRLLVKLMV